MIAKKLLALLFLLAFGLAIADTILSPQSSSPLSSISSTMLFISWLGALVNAIEARRWKWFLVLFSFSICMLPVYLFFVGPGPTRTISENSSKDWEIHTIPKKFIALLYLLGLGLIIADALLDHRSSFSITDRPTPYIGAILYMTGWIAAFANVANARSCLWFPILFFFSPITLPVYILLGPGPTQEATNT